MKKWFVNCVTLEPLDTKICWVDIQCFFLGSNEMCIKILLDFIFSPESVCKGQYLINGPTLAYNNPSFS